MGWHSFYANPITKIIYPKSLPKINLDFFNSENEANTLELVCHFEHIKNNIYCYSIHQPPCNLSVIVDDDFDYNVVQTLIQKFKKQRLSINIKKITFIGYKNKFHLFFLKNAAKTAGIEIEMIEDKDKKIRSELTGTKKEEKSTSLDHLDNEIDELINKIKKKSTILEESLRATVIEKVERLIEKYHQDLEDLKPRLEAKNTIILTNYQTPQVLKINLITELAKIEMDFMSLDANLLLKEKLEQYKIIIEDQNPPEEQKQIESIESKLKQIKYYAFIINRTKTKEELLQIIRETENHLITPPSDAITLKVNIGTTPEQELTNKLDNLYVRLKKAFILFQSLKGQIDTSLGNDMNELMSIVNYLDSENKRIYQKKIKSITNKYLVQVEDLKIDDNSELEIRKELMPILKELNNSISNMVEKRDILNDISEAKKMIKEESTNSLGAIASTTKDILLLLENATLDDTTKEKAKTSLIHILDNSHNCIINNTFQIEQKKDSTGENLNWSSKATLKILKELYGVQNFINEMINYNDEIDPTIPRFRKGTKLK